MNKRDKNPLKFNLQKVEGMTHIPIQNEHVSKFLFNSLINEATSTMARWFKGDQEMPIYIIK